MSESPNPQPPSLGPGGDSEGSARLTASVPVERDPVTTGLKGRFERIVAGSRELAMDVVEMVDLKMQLLQVQIEEHVEGRINDALQRALLVGFVVGGALFLLVAASLGLGVLFGHVALGFLAVSALLFLVAFIVGRIFGQKERLRLNTDEAEGAHGVALSPHGEEIDMEGAKR